MLDVAAELTADNKAQFEQWMTSGQVGEVAPDLARGWYDRNAELWAVVIAPWVLVQDRRAPACTDPFLSRSFPRLPCSPALC